MGTCARGISSHHVSPAICLCITGGRPRTLPPDVMHCEERFPQVFFQQSEPELNQVFRNNFYLTESTEGKGTI